MGIFIKMHEHHKGEKKLSEAFERINTLKMRFDFEKTKFDSMQNVRDLCGLLALEDSYNAN